MFGCTGGGHCGGGGWVISGNRGVPCPECNADGSKDRRQTERRQLSSLPDRFQFEFEATDGNDIRIESVAGSTFLSVTEYCDDGNRGYVTTTVRLSIDDRQMLIRALRGES